MTPLLETYLVCIFFGQFATGFLICCLAELRWPSIPHLHVPLWGKE